MNDPTGNPVRIVDHFHSQFPLSYDKYLDNNNYVTHNLVETKDNRVNFMAHEKEYEFIDSVAFP